jgi:hypothetical protein
MQLSDHENRRIDIRKQMQKIEDELFLLFAGSGEVALQTHPPGKPTAAERASLDTSNRSLGIR